MKKNFVIVGIFVLMFSSCISITTKLGVSSLKSEMERPTIPQTSSINNIDLINSLFNSRKEDYYNLTYFPTVYEASIQATYYGLFILDSIGKINTINHSQIIDYILSYKEENTSIFVDKLAQRYLDTDFSVGTFYPLSSVLEVTCYAILSLNILDRLDLINKQNSIDFIWSCYNDDSGGFIGQPYGSGLEENFKIATLDNTFFAVTTLDLLMDSWTGYENKRDIIAQFIISLQLPSGSTWDSGSFLNDNNNYFDSIFPLFEPNLLSSYYAITTLTVFGMENSINVGDFHQFLEYLYDTKEDNFRISEMDYGNNYTNIVATALGLELADISSFSTINMSGVAAFLLKNRNTLGNWDGSTEISNHELIDTFQIVRSLQNTGEISHLSIIEKDAIANATLLYQQSEGFSHLSRDYTSMNQLHTLISSYDLFDRISELNAHQLYLRIRDSYYEDSHVTNMFQGFLAQKQGSFGERFNILRSHPIEFYNSRIRYNINSYSRVKSVKYTYFALESLEKMFKLDDFGLIYDLNELKDDIIALQFLNDSYENFGAFVPYMVNHPLIFKILSNKISFDYSYYAIKSLEILTRFQGAGDLSQILNQSSFDTKAFLDYMEKNIVEDLKYLYYEPEQQLDVERILEYTYYMVYVLKALNLYNKDSRKIINYVVENLDYTNIENIYYSYKISEILDLDINFETHTVQKLVQDIYDDNLGEFYLTTEFKTIDQDIFLWICDMARNSKIGISASYLNEVPLGGYNNLSVSLTNLILRDFESYITFKFESSQLGNFTFTKLASNRYVQDIRIPISSNNYPTITGNLTAYDGLEKETVIEISFTTAYSLKNSLSTFINSTMIAFTINSSLVAQGNHSLNLGGVYMHIYKDDNYYEKVDFFQGNFNTYSTFYYEYVPEIDGFYSFEIYVNDGIQNQSIKLDMITYRKGGNDSPNNTTEPVKKDDNIGEIAIPLMVVFIAVPSCAIFVTSHHLKKVKKSSTTR